ncbi:MAG: response regulator transcription factor [Chloroflexia bacterium]
MNTVQPNPQQTDNQQSTILVVDDEDTVREMLEYNLKREGFRVVAASEGSEAVRLAYAEKPDLIVLDIMLPGMSGFDVCRAVRKELNMPILMLSAREEEIDKVLGLELGADDYLTKPFSLREMLARVRAMLRRSQTPSSQAAAKQPSSTGTYISDTETPPRLVAGDLTIDLAQHTVTLTGRVISLKPKEFDLLSFLAAHTMQVFTRETLLTRVWGYDYPGSKRTVDVHVSGLRTKLEQDPAQPQFIETVMSVGYKFVQPVIVKRNP